MSSRLTLRDVSFCEVFTRIKASRKSNEALRSETRDRQRLSKVILNPCMSSEIICNRFTENAYLLRVVCTAFVFARWSTRHNSRSVLIFMKSKRCCTSVVSTVPLLIGGEENMGNELFSRSRGSTTTWAVIVHYALPLEGFWTSPLVIIGKAPIYAYHELNTKLIAIHPGPW